MYWDEIFIECLLAVLTLILIGFFLYTCILFHYWMSSDLIKRSENMKRALEKKKPIFEKDADDPKIIYFNPKRK